MLVTRPTTSDDELVRVVTEAVAGGVDWVQFREKEAPVDAVRRRLAALRDAVGGRARLLVNHPQWRSLWELVDGVHLPEGTDSVAEARRELEDTTARRAVVRRLVGRSVHSVAAALQAQAEGADYLVAGSIFATRSHPGAPPVGLSFLREVTACVDLPVLAIGGVTPANVYDCLRAGAAGVAVLSAIMDADDPRCVAAAYRQALDAQER